MTKVILELDADEIRDGFVTATKVDEKGRRTGKMPLADVAGLMRQVFDHEASQRQVKLMSRFEDSPYIAWGQNGAKWEAVKAISPAEYYLVSATGKAYSVRLPRLVVYVGNYTDWPGIFWTADERLGPGSKIYPLVIGNTYTDGRVCTGNTGLRCRNPEDIDKYVRQLIEAPASHTVTGNTDRLYKALARAWAPGIGRRHGIPLSKLLASE